MVNYAVVISLSHYLALYLVLLNYVIYCHLTSYSSRVLRDCMCLLLRNYYRGQEQLQLEYTSPFYKMQSFYHSFYRKELKLLVIVTYMIYFFADVSGTLYTLSRAPFVIVHNHAPLLE